MLHRHRHAWHDLHARRHQPEPGRYLARTPAGGCRARLAALAGAHPLESRGVDRGLELVPIDAVADFFKQAGAALQELCMRFCEALADSIIQQLLAKPMSLLQNANYNLSEMEYAAMEVLALPGSASM